MYTNKRRMDKANYKIHQYSFTDVDGLEYWQVNIKTDDDIQTNLFRTEQEAEAFITMVDWEIFQGAL